MKEIIVRYKDGGDYMAVCGGEYVQDLIRCKECKYNVPKATEMEGAKYCQLLLVWTHDDNFCSHGDVKDE